MKYYVSYNAVLLLEYLGKIKRETGPVQGGGMRQDGRIPLNLHS
jgi:hypothetical protein